MPLVALRRGACMLLLLLLALASTTDPKKGQTVENADDDSHIDAPATQDWVSDLLQASPDDQKKVVHSVIGEALKQFDRCSKYG